MPGASVAAQRSKVFWRSGKGGGKMLRPDILLEREGERPVILDTKWKLLTAPIPSDQDLKQIFAYDALWAAREGYLVYPRLESGGPSLGKYEKEINGCACGCGVLFAEVDPELWAGETLLESLEKS